MDLILFSLAVGTSCALQVPLFLKASTSKTYVEEKYRLLKEMKAWNGKKKCNLVSKMENSQKQ